MEGFKGDNSTSGSPAVPREFRTKGRRIRRCRICKRFMDYEVLIVHMKKFHGIDITTEMNKLVLPKRLVPQCEVEGCGYVARTPAAYYKHMRNKHPVKEKIGNCTTRCPLCQAPFSDPEDLVEHCRTEHGDENCVVEMRTFQNVEEC
ncbi:zinc finger, C2H2 type, partial [Cooperia oncophora]